MPAPTTIVFGPSGNVGSAAARQAQKLGANVILALRDSGKPIKDLTAEEEAAGGFKRVEADLTKPETIKAAVGSTGAKHAFIYLVHGSDDHMRSAIEALKTAGIEFVVFLSAITVRGEIRQVQPSTGVAYAHAQVEVVLEEVFGTRGYIAVRPGWFSINTARFWSGMIQEGNVQLAYPDATWDWISPDDIGKVCGTVLVGGIEAVGGAPQRNFITLSGPKLISQRDAVGIIAKAINSEVKVTELDEDAAIDALAKSSGFPRFVAEALTRDIGRRYRDEAPFDGVLSDKAYQEASGNVVKYAGTSTGLEEWVEKNKQLFKV